MPIGSQAAAGRWRRTHRPGCSQYPIVGGIPRFVAADNYAAAFGLQWNTFKRTQFDSHTGTDITERRLAQAFGHPLEDLRGKRILEAGSGAGRFTEVLLARGREVYSFDFSNAVEANRDNNMPNYRLTLFQADISAIPFADQSFDAVVCLGVLQHTPSTVQSLRELTRVLKKGGELVCDHYRYQLGMFTSMYLPYKRHVTGRGFERMIRNLGYDQVQVRLGGTGYVCRAVK